MKKYYLILVIAAALLLEVMGAVQYFTATYGIQNELLDKANRDMEQSLRVANVKGEVESALRNIYNAVAMSIDNPKGYYSIAAGLIKNNPHIVGAGIAFRPDYYKSKGLESLYAPYVYDRQPDVAVKKKKTTNPILTTTLLPFDYTTREWFINPMEDGKSLWTQPYVDEGGTHIIMCTYCMAVKDPSGQTAGVFFADVPMEDVSQLSMDIHQGIISSRTLLFFIQVGSLLIIGFIVWLSFRAFRRYKDQYVDPEKDHLVEQLAKLREVNTRLIRRNQDLAEKVVKMQNHLKTVSSQSSESHYFG
jgi:hypothetical protein